MSQKIQKDSKLWVGRGVRPVLDKVQIKAAFFFEKLPNLGTLEPKILRHLLAAGKTGNGIVPTPTDAEPVRSRWFACLFTRESTDCIRIWIFQYTLFYWKTQVKTSPKFPKQVQNSPKWSTIFQYGPLSDMVFNGKKWFKIVQNSLKWSKIYQNVSKLLKMVQDCPEWFISCPKWSNVVKRINKEV